MQRLFQVENLIKDQNQKIEQKDQKISYLVGPE